MALHIDCVEPDDLLGSGKIPGTTEPIYVNPIL